MLNPSDLEECELVDDHNPSPTLCQSARRTGPNSQPNTPEPRLDLDQLEAQLFEKIAALDTLDENDRLHYSIQLTSRIADFVRHRVEGDELLDTLGEPLSETHPLRYCQTIGHAADELVVETVAHARELDHLRRNRPTPAEPLSPRERSARRAAELLRTVELPLPPSVAGLDDRDEALGIVSDFLDERDAETEHASAIRRARSYVADQLGPKPKKRPTCANPRRIAYATSTGEGFRVRGCDHLHCPTCAIGRHREFLVDLVDLVASRGIRSLYLKPIEPGKEARERYSNAERNGRATGKGTGHVAIPTFDGALGIADRKSRGSTEYPIDVVVEMALEALRQHGARAERERSRYLDHREADTDETFDRDRTKIGWSDEWRPKRSTETESDGLAGESENHSANPSERAVNVGEFLAHVDREQYLELAIEHGGTLSHRKGFRAWVEFASDDDRQSFRLDLERLHHFVPKSRADERRAERASRREWEDSFDDSDPFAPDDRQPKLFDDVEQLTLTGA